MRIPSTAGTRNAKAQPLARQVPHAVMPFGKHAGRYLTDLPESYVLWFKSKGYPQGKLGDLLRAIEEIKTNGLEGLLRELRERYPNPAL